jgi:hypothetical protein
MSSLASELGKNIIQLNEQYKNNEQIDKTNKTDDSEEFELASEDTSEDDIEQLDIQAQLTQQINQSQKQNISRDNHNEKMIIPEENCVVINQPSKSQSENKPIIKQNPTMRSMPIKNIKTTQSNQNNQNNMIISRKNPKNVHFDENSNTVRQIPARDMIKRNINPVQIITASQSLFERFSLSKSTIIFLIVMILIGVCASVYQKFISHN